ncbi:MAG: hypothetical protein AAFY48_06955 [Bacteroidota bacterium]
MSEEAEIQEFLTRCVNDERLDVRRKTKNDFIKTLRPTVGIVADYTYFRPSSKPPQVPRIGTYRYYLHSNGTSIPRGSASCITRIVGDWPTGGTSGVDVFSVPHGEDVAWGIENLRPYRVAVSFDYWRRPINDPSASPTKLRGYYELPAGSKEPITILAAGDPFQVITVQRQGDFVSGILDT